MGMAVKISTLFCDSLKNIEQSSEKKSPYPNYLGNEQKDLQTGPKNHWLNEKGRLLQTVWEGFLKVTALRTNASLPKE